MALLLERIREPAYIERRTAAVLLRKQAAEIEQLKGIAG